MPKPYPREFREDVVRVSHALVQHVGEVTTLDTQPGSITDHPSQRRNEPASDHRPVLARF